MKTLITLLVGSFLLGANLAASADEASLSSRSAGKLKADQSIDLSARIAQQAVTVRERSGRAEDYASSGLDAMYAGVANRHDQLFEIYDADVALVADFDGDGYHHALKLYFDVDVSVESATVYAKLYLSREGEPWHQYFTTDLFEIHGDSFDDAYEVETELVDGYSPGYYDVLIEIYSLDHAFMVASQVLDYHYLGRDVMLEDRNWDDSYDEFYGEVSYSSHGAGDFGALLVFFLLVQVAIAARGFLALTPLQKSDNNKKKMKSLRCDLL